MNQTPPQPAAAAAAPIQNNQVQYAPKQEQSNQQQQQQSKINLLIINPSPRKILWFQVKLDILNQKYDIYRERFNFDETDAYKQCRNFFLEHEEYTHMAILPDDLLVDLRHVDKLVADLEQFDYDVLSGISNFAASTKNFMSRMTCIPYSNYGAVDELERTGRFNFFKQTMTRKELEKLRKDMAKKSNRIIRVALSNFPLTIIKRSVVEQIEFGNNWMGVDCVFFQDCLKKHIPAYADLDVEMLHIKGIEENHELTTAIVPAFEKGITTKIYSKSIPHEQVFLPKIQQTAE